MNKSMIREFLDNDKYINDSIGFYANTKHRNKIKEFASEVEKISDELKGYGYTIEIQIDAISGNGNSNKLNIRLVPYESGRNHLVEYWDDINPYKLYYVIDADYNEDLVAEDEKAEHSSMYIPVLSFVFLQIYAKKEQIINELYVKAFNDLNKHINHQDLLYNEAIKMANNNSLQSLVKQLNSKRTKTCDFIGCDAYDNFGPALEEFYNDMLKFAEPIKDYGDSIKIILDIYDGAGNLSPYCICLSPYIIKPDYDNKRDFIIGYFTNEEDVTLYDSYMPGYTYEKIDEKTKAEKRFFMPVQSHIFVQIYNKKDIILKMLDDKLLKDIEKKENMNNLLYRI